MLKAITDFLLVLKRKAPISGLFYFEENCELFCTILFQKLTLKDDQTMIFY